GRELEDNRRRINDELKTIAENDSFTRTRSSLSLLSKELLEVGSGYLSLSYIDASTGKVLTRFETGGDFGLAARNREILQASEQKLVSQLMAGFNTASITRSRVTMLDGGLDDESRVPVEGTAVAVYQKGIESPVGILVSQNDLSAALSPQQVLNTDTQLYIVNSEGEVLTGLQDQANIEQGSIGLDTLFPGVQFVDSENPDEISGTIFQLADGQELLLGFKQEAAYAVVGEPLLFIYTGSREQMEMTATRIGENLQRIAQFNLLIAIAIGWFFARRVSKPVQQISAAAVEFGRSGSVVKLPDAGEDEIGLLTKSLSEMMYEVTSQRESLLLLSQAVESSVECTVITNITGTIQYVNPEYERYAGVKSEDIIGKNIMELPEFVENRHILSESQAKKGSEMVWVGEMRSKRADGQLHDEYVTIAPIRNAEGEQINQSMIIEDITQRKEMERHIDLKTEELQRSNRDLEQFAYVASHDLKAPLRAIEVLVSWLKDDLEEFEGGDVHENLDLLEQRTTRLARLLDDLLAYSRAGRKIGGVKKIDVREFVEDISSLLAPPEGFVIEADESLPSIVTHHAPLETVFRNLMSNAIKHSPDPSKGRIHVSAEDRGDKVEFVVQDNGTGIPQEYAEKVFKMFQTLKARDEMEGSGMGLAIVKRIIDWQLGDIWFEDGPDGVGTVFRFTWSKAPVELPDMPDAAAADAVESPLEKPVEEAPVEETQEEYIEADQTIIRNSHAELMEE
ncbi:MAG: sensor histidine kinase, partial [Gammaproteobacteria bacterium]